MSRKTNWQAIAADGPCKGKVFIVTRDGDDDFPTQELPSIEGSWHLYRFANVSDRARLAVYVVV